MENLKSDLNRFEQNGLKQIKAKQGLQQYKAFAQIQKSHPEIRQSIKKMNQSKSQQRLDSMDFKDLKNDAQLMQKAEEQNQLPNAVFSDSDDEDCIVKDDNEEGMSTNINYREDRGSFRLPQNKSQSKKQHPIKHINSSSVSSVSSKKNIPRFNLPQTIVRAKNGEFAINEESLSEEEEQKSYSRSVKESIFSATEGRVDEEDYFSSNNRMKNNNTGKQNKEQYLRNSLESFIHPKVQSTPGANDSNPFNNSIQNLSILHPQYTANFQDEDSKQVIRMSELDAGLQSQNKSINYSASDENDRQFLFNQQNQGQFVSPFYNNNISNNNNLQNNRKMYRETSKERISLEISERINEINKSQSRLSIQSNIRSQQIQNNLGSYLSSRNLSKLNIKSGFNQQKKSFVPSINSYKYNRQSPLSISSNQDLKKLLHLTLSCEELDKFKEKKLHPDIKVMTTFYQDPALDQALFTGTE
ncbi:UNKNOWN [Stylonychia lemnae]|uniref:Uncharacterized protein n=1 Tax=Stylonychia lemnae TaxID=5949 RepID=A0A078AZV5_STYLE|nr:UNKNOWN [Stylonychia lemnae]|eukprot:CDW87940.1 UNKNOWN [Stylonychia lemnae]